jgi:hypothetical protein
MVPDSMPAVNPRLTKKVLKWTRRPGGVQVTECAKDMDTLQVALRAVFV